jgi:hypothetical protein
MSASPNRAHRFLLAVALLVSGCGSRRQPGQRALPVHPVPAKSAAPSSLLYGADEALSDVLSSPWQYVGTGPWPGISRMYACAFYNERVVLVNVYCGSSERHAFRLEVYSPARGHARLYAETRGPLSASRAQDYFTFMVESEPPLRAVPLPRGGTLTFEALRRYEEQRYGAYQPACFIGRELSRARNGCLGTLAAEEPAFRGQNRAFIAQGSSAFERVIRELGRLAQRHGKEPD